MADSRDIPPGDATAADPQQQTESGNASDSDEAARIHAELLAGGLGSRSRSPSSGSRGLSRSCSRSPSSSIEKTVGVNFDEYEKVTVNVRGDNVPPCFQAFEDSDLPEKLKEITKAAGFERPTPVQKYAVPIVLAGRDLMASAQTGSGKTLAFALPIIGNLLNGGMVLRPFFPGKLAMASPLAVILAPTRELVQQIDTEIKRLLGDTGIKCAAIFGGDNFQEQAAVISCIVLHDYAAYLRKAN